MHQTIRLPLFRAIDFDIILDDVMWLWRWMYHVHDTNKWKSTDGSVEFSTSVPKRALTVVESSSCVFEISLIYVSIYIYITYVWYSSSPMMEKEMWCQPSLLVQRPPLPTVIQFSSVISILMSKDIPLRLFHSQPKYCSQPKKTHHGPLKYLRKQKINRRKW